MFTAPDPEEISISIEGETFRHWTEIEISVAFDGHALVSFSAPFEPDEIEFRETFRPFSFKEIEVLLGGDPGIGKLTLLLQTANQLARETPILYVCAEESGQQVKLRSLRLGMGEAEASIHENLYLLPETNF